MKIITAIMFCMLIQEFRALPIDDNSLGEGDFIDISHLGSAIYGNPDNDTGVRLSQWSPGNGNPEELGSYLEGDILVPRPEGRNGLASQASRWNNGIVPFEIRGNFNALQMNLIEQAINEYHAKTCIRFVPHMGEKDYISIVSSETGCWSSVGRIGGRQEVNFQTPGCLNKVGTAIHELMHAIGFLHEQNRSERDDHITVNWANVKKGTEPNFDKASASSTNAFGVGYDYGSVMHYASNAFSSNGRPTIVAKRSTGSKIMGQRNGFSLMDVEKLNRMYKCNNKRRERPTRRQQKQNRYNPNEYDGYYSSRPFPNRHSSPYSYAPFSNPAYSQGPYSQASNSPVPFNYGPQSTGAYPLSSYLGNNLGQLLGSFFNYF